MPDVVAELDGEDEGDVDDIADEDFVGIEDEADDEPTGVMQA